MRMSVSDNCMDGGGVKLAKWHRTARQRKD